MNFNVKYLPFLIKCPQKLGYMKDENIVILSNIYSLGFLLVLVFMIGFTIDFMKGIIDDISNDDWGIE